MPLSPQPLHAAEQSQPSADEAPHGFQEWSRQVGDSPVKTGKAQLSIEGLPTIDLGHPLVKVAAVAFVGYVLGRLIHRR